MLLRQSSTVSTLSTNGQFKRQVSPLQALPRTVSSLLDLPNPSAIPHQRFLRLGPEGSESALEDRAAPVHHIQHAVARSLPTPNAIHTRRFRWYSWLPKSLYWQMKRVANIYFVAIALLAITPLWAPRKWTSKVMMVTLVLMLQAFKDLFEDLKRGRDDREDNTRTTLHYDHGEEVFISKEWQHCKPGDLLLIREGELIPADVLILASNKANGQCNLSTKSLDGETNLKQRQAPDVVQSSLKGIVDLDAIAGLLFDTGFECVLNEPCADVRTLDGSIQIDGDTEGISIENFALRGCKLELTEWVLSIVCYVGNETKIMLNMTSAPTKHSELEQLLNKCVTVVLVFIIVVSTLCMVCSQVVMPSGLPFYDVWVKYFIIQYPIMPMTLYIALEMMHLIIGWQIQQDPLMFDKAHHIHAAARNSALVEELGQVEYVFSDKTGTLTANEMRFAYCCIQHNVVGPFHDDAAADSSRGVIHMKGLLHSESPRQLEAREFLEFLAVCHTVFVDESSRTYNGESPDEVALVKGAQMVDVELVARRASSTGSVEHIVRAPWYPGGTKNHKLSYFIPFTSDRKRMSVICSEPDGGAVVFTKGADSVMQGLLCDPWHSDVSANLREFSHQGLRTLILAKRRLDAPEYSAWKLRWHDAKAAMQGRAKKLEEVEAEIEKELTFVGVTALEDRLQDNVATTIIRLRQAGMHVWMLTGDKVETAIEIAKSCHLFDSTTQLMQIVDVTSVADALKMTSRMCSRRAVSRPQGRPCGVVLDGMSLQYILKSERAKEELYRLGEESACCIGCRLSPLQKRQLVELVRHRNRCAVTLAIGDGANDVPMIQGAHLGVGIKGKEGASAVQASDMSIVQFQFLGNLLICHGRKAYRRIASFLGFFLYKSAVVTWGYVLYAQDNAFQGNLAYPEWLDVTYNPFTSCAVLIVLAFDSDISDEDALHDPLCYWPGPARGGLNSRIFAGWMASATWHGILCWSVPVYLLTTKADRIDQTKAFWEASCTAYTAVIIVVHLKLLLVARKSITVIGMGSILLEMLAYFAFLVALGLPIAAKLAPELRGIPQRIFESPKHHTFIHLVCCTVPPFAAVIVEALIHAMITRVTACMELRRQQKMEAAGSDTFERQTSDTSQLTTVRATHIVERKNSLFSEHIEALMQKNKLADGFKISNGTGFVKEVGAKVAKPFASRKGTSFKPKFSLKGMMSCCKGGPPPSDDLPSQPLLRPENKIAE